MQLHGRFLSSEIDNAVALTQTELGDLCRFHNRKRNRLSRLKHSLTQIRFQHNLTKVATNQASVGSARRGRERELRRAVRKGVSVFGK